MKNTANLLFSKYKTFICCIMAALAVITACNFNILEPYDFITWILFFMLILFTRKTDLKQPDYWKPCLGFSLLFSVLFVFGRYVFLNYDSASVNILALCFSPKALFYVIGTASLLYPLFCHLLPGLCRYMPAADPCMGRYKAGWVFIFCFIVIFAAYMPYFLNEFPGALSSDSYSNLNFAFANTGHLRDHYPLLYQILMSIPLKLGMYLFDDINGAVACASIFQMLLMAGIFAGSVVFLYRRKIPNFIAVLALIYYALLPVHGYYSVTMWKDIPFSCFVLLLVMEMIRLVERKGCLRGKDYVSFALLSLLTLFFRNNAIYAYFVIILFTLLLFRQHRKTFAVTFLSVLVLFYGIKGPVFDLLQVEKSSSAEYIGIPLQQIGRMAFKGIKFTEEQEELIDELIPVETLAQAYNPKVSDGIKFNDAFDIDQFNAHKADYLKLWLELVIAHPATAIEAYLVSTVGYWYPSFDYWCVVQDITPDKYDLVQHSYIGDSKLYSHLSNKSIPLLNMEWSISLCFFLLLILGWAARRRNGWIGILPYIPLLGIWLTMMAASPVFGEYRYVYAAFTSLPVLFFPACTSISAGKCTAGAKIPRKRLPHRQ